MQAFLRQSLLSLAAILLCSGGAGAAAELDPDGHVVGKPICVPARETGEEIKTRKLLEPFTVLKAAGAQYKAEPLAAKLCHVGDDFIYEITLLHKDGRVIHAVLDALTGKAVAPRASLPAPPKP